MLSLVYAYAIHLRAPFDATVDDFRTVVVLPSLYPIVAVAGAGARRLLDRQAAAEETLADQERTMAVQAERERLGARHARLAGQDRARDRLRRARALAADPGRPAGPVEDARKLADDARTAAQEARELLSGLRGRDDAELPLPTAIRSEAARWGERTGTRVGGSLDDVGPLPSLVAARAALDPQGGARQRRALRPRDPRRHPPAAPRRARRADRRRRRRRL